MGARKDEGFLGAVESQLQRFFTNVRVVAFKFDGGTGRGHPENENGMIDGEPGEGNYMDDGKVPSLDGLLKARAHGVLAEPGEGQDHAPVPALKVALPGTAAALAEQFRMRGAELAQCGKAGDDDF